MNSLASSFIYANTIPYCLVQRQQSPHGQIWLYFVISYINYISWWLSFCPLSVCICEPSVLLLLVFVLSYPINGDQISQMVFYPPPPHPIWTVARNLTMKIFWAINYVRKLGQSEMISCFKCKGTCFRYIALILSTPVWNRFQWNNVC